MAALTLLVYRGPEIPLGAVHEAAREVLGGHLRPDADLVVHTSAPVRVDRRGRAKANPLAGTVRVLHLATATDVPSILTDLSRMVLPSKLGFRPELEDFAWEQFGHAPAEAVALALSRRAGPIAAMSVDEEDDPVGSYSLFSAGSRLWSAVYRPAVSYASWDGDELRIEPMEAGDPHPIEGGPGDFPPHGMNLLFPEPLELTHAERSTLTTVLWRAARPPTDSAEGMWLVESGRFIEPGRPLSPEDWARFTISFAR
ncbi:MAG: hypothetical protein GY898_19215 [Proteobacteria bacterium]|nr:hypothetical protein [Pseudomonadota bacterium]